MSEWFWVTLGYGTAYGALGGYLLTIIRRRALLRRREAVLRCAATDS